MAQKPAAIWNRARLAASLGYVRKLSGDIYMCTRGPNAFAMLLIYLRNGIRKKIRDTILLFHQFRLWDPMHNNTENTAFRRSTHHRAHERQSAECSASIRSGDEGLCEGLYVGVCVYVVAPKTEHPEHAVVRQMMEIGRDQDEFFFTFFFFFGLPLCCLLLLCRTFVICAHAMPYCECVFSFSCRLLWIKLVRQASSPSSPQSTSYRWVKW